MSYVAIAAALALEDVSTGERLAAFSLASFANQDHRAWPGTRIAAARAGLSRSQFRAARDSLQQRGLLAVEESGGGRGHSAVVALIFAETGPWLEAEINAELFETVLGYSRARGAARLLQATLAGLADETGEVANLTTDEIRTAAGIADATYRRARTALVATNEVVLDTAGGGRARTNRWTVPDPRDAAAQPIIASRRPVVRSRTPRPLVASEAGLVFRRFALEHPSLAAARNCGHSSERPRTAARGGRQASVHWGWRGRKGSGIERGIGRDPGPGPDRLG